MNNNLSLTLLLLSLWFSAVCQAADITLTPVKLRFVAQQKTDVLKIKNLQDVPVRLQLSVYAWTQDAAGADQLSATDDIVAFPKILEVAGGSEHIIRVGSRVLPGEREKTYRLYLEELPGQEPPAEEGTVIRTLTKIGIPVFVAPTAERAAKPEVRTALSDGGLNVAVSNPGNVHFIIQSVRVNGLNEAGASIMQQEVAGWYLHPGHDKNFSFELSRDDCLAMRDVDVAVVTNRSTSSERLHVPQEMCTH